MRRSIGIGVLSAATFAGGALWAHAQVQPNNPRPLPNVIPTQIISGADFGFRVDGVGPDGKPTGRIVVRQEGKWVEVALASTAVRRLTGN